MTTATPSNTKSNPYGIAAGGGLGQMSDAQIRAQVKGMKDLGVQWVRFDIDWSTVQPDGAGTYNWRGYDTLVSALNTYGLSPLAVITYTPGWARIDGCNSEHCRPATAASFANFAGAAAQRYAGRGVRSWEIWNEPNWSEFWLPKPDPVFYTEMLTASYRAIKSVDTGSTVLTGGTAQANTSADAYSAPDFLNGIYQNGGKNFFDAVANHPYTFPFLPSYSWSWNKWLEMAQPGGVRGLMVSHGDSAKKVWITEYGAATNGPGSSANNGSISSDASADHVSDQLQARMITETVNLYRGLSWAGPLFWYTYQDDGTDVNNVEHFFGLLRADGSVKPAYQSYQQAIGSR